MRLKLVLLSALLLGLLSLPSVIVADNRGQVNPAALVPAVSDLRTLAVSARSRHLPIVLVYAASDCEHCERLDQEVLEPFMLSGELSNKAIIRKIMIDGVDSITDFKGKQQDAEYYSIMRDVEVTPTIEFVDADGTQLVSPMIGYQGVDMYQSYFSAAIEASKLIVSAQQKN